MTQVTREEVTEIVREATTRAVWAQAEALIALIEALAFAMHQAGADLELFKGMLRRGLNWMPDDDPDYAVVRSFYQRVLEDLSQDGGLHVVQGGREK